MSRPQELVERIKREKARAEAQRPLNVKKIRGDFPALNQKVYGKPLVYLDNAATTQKPQLVISTLNRYYTLQNANIHRGVYYLSEKSTDAYESARVKVQRFLNARESREIIFVRGATEAINLVASAYGRVFIKSGDEIVISTIEHHSNIVPWQMLCEATGAKLRVIPVNDRGEIRLGDYGELLSRRTKLVAIGHVSNALGTINPVREIIEKAHRIGAAVLVDGAQAAPHLKLDVQELDCEFYVFSGHKAYAPTGIGALYGKSAVLEKMTPYQGGGDMIKAVTFEKTLYNTLPYKYEAGTPHIAGAIGLGAAIDYLNELGLERIAAYEKELLEHGTELLSRITGLRLIGTAKQKACILSFVLAQVHPHDLGTILDQEGIAIRAGHHCAMPTMERFGVPATARASLAFYNTKEELDHLAEAIERAIEIFR